MTETIIQEFREEYASRLRDYLKAAGISADDVLTVCPRCGDTAGLLQNGGWTCANCGAKGDLFDYVQISHPYMRATTVMHHVKRMLGERITELDAINGNDLMEMRFPPAGWLVENLLGKGLYILAGASKIGKSWLVLWLADRISKGEPVWEMKTFPCECLYVSLEDTDARIQQRLCEVTAGEAGGIWIATESEWLGGGFETQLCCFLTEHPKTGFVIIDTLQRVRKNGGEKYSYANDYEIMTVLKDIADRFNITILVVHHTRKEDSDDPFDLISGTTGLMGCADGALLLQRKNRLTGEACLYVTGRESADQALKLEFDAETRLWRFLEYVQEQKSSLPDKLFIAIRDLVAECGEWHGTPTDLVTALSPVLPPDVKPHALTRRLNASSEILLQKYGVQYQATRTMDARQVCLSAVPMTQ